MSSNKKSSSQETQPPSLQKFSNPEELHVVSLVDLPWHCTSTLNTDIQVVKLCQSNLSPHVVQITLKTKIVLWDAKTGNKLLEEDGHNPLRPYQTRYRRFWPNSTNHVDVDWQKLPGKGHMISTYDGKRTTWNIDDIINDVTPFQDSRVVVWTPFSPKIYDIRTQKLLFELKDANCILHALQTKDGLLVGVDWFGKVTSWQV